MKKIAIFLFTLSLLFTRIFAQGLILPAFADSITWSDTKKDKITATANKGLTKSLIISHNGERVYEYGDVHQTYHIFSARKSILSLLYGIYIERGVINPESTLADLEIDDKLGLTDNEKQARVIDLLRARSGVYHPSAYETPGMEKNRPKRGAFKPNEHWFYNNWDFNTLTTIFEKQTGKHVFDAFLEDISMPLDMTGYDLGTQKYHQEDVSIHPATIWYFSTNQLELLGQLLLEEGAWNGNQIIPSDWITESTASYSDCGILGGYGYCWWTSLNGMHYPFVNIPDGSYSARGTGEQTLLVIPEWEMIIVHLTEVTSPEDDIMHVTDFGKLLAIILEQKRY